MARATTEPRPTSPDAPPVDPAAEEYVLGACLLSGRAIDAASEIIRPGDFYRRSLAVAFQGCLDLYADGAPVDAVTLADHLAAHGLLDQAGGHARLHELQALVPAASNVAHYARIVRDHATLRGMLRAGTEIQRLARERGADAPELLEEAERVVFDLAQGRRGQRDFADFDALVHDAFRQATDMHESGRDLLGVPTGFVDLDRVTAGYQPGDLIVLGARPSLGKSSHALATALHLAVGKGLPVAVFSLEMNRRQVTQRLLAADARIDLMRLRTGRLRDDEWPKLARSSERLAKAPMHVDDSGVLTLADVRSKTRRLKARHADLALVVVDYVQLMTQDAENRVQEVSRISRGLKALAGDLDVPVLALSQLSRQLESRHDKRPMLSDLRETGALEQDADVVLFLYRDEVYHPDEPDQAGVAEVLVAKQRNGPTGTVRLAFVKKLATFTDLAPEAT